MTIYDAAMKYKAAGVPLVILAGKEYGSGSSRDWAAKGTLLLGVQRGHRRELRAHSPQQPREHGRAAARSSRAARTRRRSASPAREVFEIVGIADGLKPGGHGHRARHRRRRPIEFEALVRIDTPEELVAFRHGGILPYVLRQLVGKK